MGLVVFAFGAGAFYQRERTARALVELRQQALSLMPEKAAEAVAVMTPARVDETLLALVQASQGRGSTALYNFNIYKRYTDVWRAHRNRDPSAVLEIGPGSNVAQGVIFTMSGARKYYGLDIYRDPDFYKRHSYEAVATLLTSVAPSLVKTAAADIFRVDGDKVVLSRDKLEFLYPHQSYDIPLAPGSVEFIFSHAVFEHIADPAATLEALARVLPRGGLTAHQIDMRDHRNFAAPLEFLKVERKAWDGQFNDSNAHHYMNRWRLPDFTAAFEKSGFRIIRVEVNLRHAVTEEMRKSLHPDFQRYSLEDLSAVGAFIVAEKR
jgi:SAM-dependent methyltransferase